MALRPLLHTLVCSLAACGGSLADEERPNIVLISIDSARRDLFGSYGFSAKHAPREPSSPAFDRLAAEGVLFENASATSSWTLPSHMSLLTGTPELVHGVELDGAGLFEDIPILAEILREHGYATRGVYSGPYLDPRHGFGRGFDSYQSGYGPELEAAAAEWERVTKAEAGQHDRSEIDRVGRRLEQASHEDRSAPSVSELALGHLEEMAAGEPPFFLFVHFFDPHYDYVPPAADATRFDPAYRGAMDGRNFINDPRVALFGEEPGLRERVLSERDLEHVLALYAAELAATDREVGRILDRIDALGLAAETIVVACSDHGDEFFEHGGLGHRRTLYEEVLAVPLVMRFPGRIEAGQRLGTSVSLTGVAPALLELSGIPTGELMQGHGLLDAIRSPEDHQPALGRLVRVDYVQETLAAGTRTSTVLCYETTVLESCRLGDIKVTRELRTLAAVDSLPVVLGKALMDRNLELARTATPLWIDLARHPSEPDELHSADFSHEAARRAFEVFQREWERLNRSQQGPEMHHTDDEQLLRLRGLGYLDVDALPQAPQDTPLSPPTLPGGEGR